MPGISAVKTGLPFSKKGFNFVQYWTTQPLTAVVENTDATKIVITFTKALDESSVPAASAFSVPGKTVSAVAIASNVLTLTVSAAFIYGDGVHVFYTPPAANPLQTSGNYAPFWNISATNNIVYTLPTDNLKFDYFGGDGTSIPTEISITGGNVTAIADRTANDYDLSETGAGNTTHELSVAGVGRGALVMGGNSCFLRTISGAILANGAAHTIAVVYSTTSVGDAGTFYMEGSTTSSTPLFRNLINNLTNVFGIQHRDDASNLLNITAGFNSSGITTNDGDVHLAIFRRSGTTHQQIIDDVSGTETTKTMGTTSVDRMGFGGLIQGSVTPSVIFIGKMFAIVGYDIDNNDSIASLLARYYNINLYPTTINTSFDSSIDTI